MDEAEMEFEEAGDEASAESPIWILKPSTVNKGAGIQIVHCYAQVVDVCWTESDIREWVLQRYITPPLLLRKRKFHIRAYVAAVSAIQVYLYDKCLALCSGSKYDSLDTTNALAHITNTAYQSIDPNFDEDSCVLEWNKDVPSVLVKDKTCKNLKQAQAKVQYVTDQMRIITGEVFHAYKNEFGVFAPIEGCFEQFGLDFVVDADWNVYLLEINPGPDFKQSGDRLSPIIQSFMGACIDVALLGKESGDQQEDGDLLTLVYEHQMRGSKSRYGKHKDTTSGIQMKVT
eukprot:scaffold293832_cov58-Attheya_sp.AAC.2